MFDGEPLLTTTPSTVNAPVKLRHCTATVDAMPRTKPTPDAVFVAIAESERHAVAMLVLPPRRPTIDILHSPCWEPTTVTVADPVAMRFV
jgi:hypothetical protein